MSVLTSGFLKVFSSIIHLVNYYTNQTVCFQAPSLRIPGKNELSCSEITGTAEEISTDLLTHQSGGGVGVFSCFLLL